MSAIRNRMPATQKIRSRKGYHKSRADNGPTTNDVLEALWPLYARDHSKPRYDPTSELVFTILSQHTSDVNSGRAFQQLMKDFGTLDAVADGDVTRIAESIKSGGLARIKAPRIKEVLNRIKELRGGSLDLHFLKEMPLPEAKAWLRQLPGIGPKSAAVILCFSLDMPAMAVDTHVFRVSKRLGLIGPKTSYEDAHDILEGAVPPEQVYALHIALIMHGRRVCKAPRPLCHECILNYGCPSRHLGLGGGGTNNIKRPK